MNEPEQQAIDCLATRGYEVLPDGTGYIVRHRSDPQDVSRARHLEDLIELAQLVEWRAQREQRAERGSTTDA
jgi:hypothetical protein